MTQTRTVPTLVVGLGCRRGCQVEEIQALLERSLKQAGIALNTIRALASIELKQHEPGLLQLAQQLQLPFRVFSAQQLSVHAAQLSHRSNLSLAHTGCYGVAESAALALADHLTGQPARLLITRQTSAGATFAVACCG